jgi:uncharacterized protein
MEFFRTSTRQLGRLHPLFFVYLVLFFSYVVLMPLLALEQAAPHAAALQATGGPENLPAFPLLSRLIMGSLIVPALETTVFQWLPLRLACTWLKLPPLLGIAVSAVFFGVAHNYSVGYVVFTTLIGAVLAWGFVARDYDGGRAFLWIAVVHALRNAVSALLM